jgi:multiple sugar transport system permease protein
VGGRVLYLAVVSVVTLVWLIPTIWTVSLSFRPEEVLRRSTSGFLPLPFTLDNYVAILQSSLVPRWFLNSVVVSVAHTLLVLAVSALAAYAFARIPFKGKGLVFPAVLAGLMVPSQVTIIPIYLMMAHLHWHNTYPALFLPGIAAPFGLFLLTQFFKAIPVDIEEAAMLDGANRLTSLVRIILPLSLPALTTLGLITFLGIWNDFLWPLISATRPESQTITVGLPLLIGDYGTIEYLGRSLAAAWVGGAPVMVVFLLFQRHLIRGMSIGDSF